MNPVQNQQKIINYLRNLDSDYSRPLKEASANSEGEQNCKGQKIFTYHMSDKRLALGLCDQLPT